MIAVVVAVEVMSIILQPVAMGVAVEVVVVVVAAMVVVVVGGVVVLAVSGSSGSTRSAGGHSARGSGGRRWPPLHTTNLLGWLALYTAMLVCAVL